MKYFLFDGIQLPSNLHERLHGMAACHWVYGDLEDKQAHSAGPIVTLAQADAETVAEEIRALPCGGTALTVVESEASLAALAEHFRALRYVSTHDRRRYFFRFADTRAFGLLWNVMTPAQQVAVMAPFTRWEYSGRDGQPVVVQVPTDTRAARLPLQLDPAQVQRMLALMQPDQLLATVLELDPTLAEQMDNVQRHTLACKLCDLLQREGIESHAIRITALQTLLRSGAWLLAEPGFAQVLRDAQTRGDSAMISDWVAGASNADSERGIT